MLVGRGVDMYCGGEKHDDRTKNLIASPLNNTCQGHSPRMIAFSFFTRDVVSIFTDSLIVREHL